MLMHTTFSATEAETLCFVSIVITVSKNPGQVYNDEHHDRRPVYLCTCASPTRVDHSGLDYQHREAPSPLRFHWVQAAYVVTSEGKSSQGGL